MLGVKPPPPPMLTFCQVKAANTGALPTQNSLEAFIALKLQTVTTQGAGENQGRRNRIISQGIVAVLAVRGLFLEEWGNGCA